MDTNNTALEELMRGPADLFVDHQEYLRLLMELDQSFTPIDEVEAVKHIRLN